MLQLPTEILLKIFLFLQPKDLLALRATSQTTKKIAEAEVLWDSKALPNTHVKFDFSSLAAQNFNSKLEAEDITPITYKKLINDIREAGEQQFIHKENYQTFVTKTVDVRTKALKDYEERVWDHAKTNAIVGMSLSVVGMVATLLLLIKQENAVYSDISERDHCSKFSLDENALDECQAHITQLLINSAYFWSSFGATVGFLTKLLDHVLLERLMIKILHQLLPKLDDAHFAAKNKLHTFFTKAVENRDYLFLAAAAFLTSYLLIDNPIYFDIKKCPPEQNQIVFNNRCFKKNIANQNELIAKYYSTDTFLMAYALISASILLCKMAKKLGVAAKENCMNRLNEQADRTINEESGLQVRHSR